MHSRYPSSLNFRTGRTLFYLITSVEQAKCLSWLYLLRREEEVSKTKAGVGMLTLQRTNELYISIGMTKYYWIFFHEMLILHDALDLIPHPRYKIPLADGEPALLSLFSYTQYYHSQLNWKSPFLYLIWVNINKLTLVQQSLYWPNQQ